MYIRRKLYSNIEGEYVPVEQTVLYSAKDDAKGAAVGAGIAAGAAGLGYAAANSDKAADFLKERRAKATDKAIKIKGEAARKMQGVGQTNDAARANFDKIKEKADKIIKSNEEAGKAEKFLRNLGSKTATATQWVKTNPKLAAGIAAGTIAAGAAAGAGIAHLKGKKKAEEKVYSVLMTEDELALFSEIQKEFADSYEDLNYGDLTRNLVDKNPFTIKKLRELKREHLSKEKGKGRGHSALRSIGTATAGAIGGAIGGGSKAGYKGAAIGALGGAALGATAGYGADRAARRLRNKIRKSGGGGIIDDAYARESDRLAMLDGKMSKADFKKKWYRNDQAE